MARVQSIETLRARIAALIAERDALRNAPPTAAERRANVHAWCRAQAANAQAGIAYRVETGDYSDLLAVRVTGNRVDLAPTLAALIGPDGLADALCKHIADTPDGMAAEDREARVVEIGHELEDLETQEERLIEATESTGRPIARRGDARPEIILAVHP